MNDLEDTRDLRDLMERSLAGHHPDAAHLGAESRKQGRRLRRRRRAGTAAAGLAVSAVAVAAVAAGLGGGLPVLAKDDPADSSPSGTPAVRTAEAQATFPSSLGVVQVPARELLHRLTPLLPGDVSVIRADVTRTDVAPGESTRRVGDLLVGLDRPGHVRRGGLDLFVYAAPDRPLSSGDPAVSRATSCPPLDDTDVVVTHCTVLTGDGGAPIGRELSYTDGDFTIREVLRQSAAGNWVYVADANSLDRKWGAGYAALPGSPPLSLDELRTIAASPTWDDPPSGGELGGLGH